MAIDLANTSVANNNWVSNRLHYANPESTVMKFSISKLVCANKE